MNKVILMGRLTRDPEIRYSGGDNALAIGRFSLAVDRRSRKNSDGADADFFNCTAFGRQAEFVEKYLKQGTKILLVGRIQNDNYTNREGQKVYSVQVIAEEIEFAESKNASAAARTGSGYGAAADSGYGAAARTGSGYGAGENSGYGGYGSSGRPDPADAVGDGFMNIPDGVDDEELPFN